MAKNNIIWILLDGVRNYPTPHDPDKMGKPEIIDKIAAGGVEFKQMITAATSTWMSLMTFLTGLPIHFLAQNYRDFFLEKSVPLHLSKILRENDYKVYCMGTGFGSRMGIFGEELLPHVPSKYWMKGHRKLVHWTNTALPGVLNNLIESKMEEPFMLYMHFTGRRDGELSDKVYDCIESLKRVIDYDNSILIICSDHGMPDHERFDYTSWLSENKMSYRKHDLIMTDDNILVPFVIKFPGCPVGLKIKETTGTIDFFPTILDLLDMKPELNRYAKNSFGGKSLLPLITPGKTSPDEIKKLNGRLFRTETRFSDQANRIISLRSNRFKYVYAYDVEKQNGEQFYDLETDPYERENIISSTNPEIKSWIKLFRGELEKSNKEAVDWILDKSEKRLKDYLKPLLVEFEDEKKYEFLVIGSCRIPFAGILNNLLKRVVNNCVCDLLFERSNPHSRKALSDLGYRNNIYVGDYFDNKSFKLQSLTDSYGVGPLLDKYDILFVPITDYKQDIRQSRLVKTEGEMQYANPDTESYTEGNVKIDTTLIKDYKEIIKIARFLKIKKKVYFDSNFRFYSGVKSAFLKDNLKKVNYRKEVYLTSPTAIFSDIKRIIFP